MVFSNESFSFNNILSHHLWCSIINFDYPVVDIDCELYDKGKTQ